MPASARYLNRIEHLLSDPPPDAGDSDRVNRVSNVAGAGEADGPPLSALVEVYEERVERRSTWLNAELLPAAKRERPIRHVLGPRPLRVVLEDWFEGLKVVRVPSLRSAFARIARWSRDHRTVLRQVALLVVVAALSSLGTLIVTRW